VAGRVAAERVAVCSTGLIGVRLPMDKVAAGINDLVPLVRPDGGQAAAEAILTTDSVTKQASYSDEGWSIGGMAKGAGMLAPGLATMLVVLTTDAVVDPEQLHDQLVSACRRLRADRQRRLYVHQRHGDRDEQRSIRRPTHTPGLPGCTG
jgi:glutamate N-acetyltransferase/amino-acid N-acetyltransferase